MFRDSTALPIEKSNKPNIVSRPRREDEDANAPQTLTGPAPQQPARDGTWRYTTRGHQSLLRKQRTQRQRLERRKRSVLKKKLYEDYMHVLSVKGNEQDFLPTSRSSGPLIEIFERLVKKEYRLGRNERSTRMRQFYADQGPSMALPSNILLPSRCKKYIGCQLPRVSRRMTEMRQVDDGIEVLFREGALAMDTVEEAHEICKHMIEKYYIECNRPLTAQLTCQKPRDGAERRYICSKCHDLLSQEIDGTPPADELPKA